MSLRNTRKILDAIHSDVLDKVEFEHFPVFGFKIPKTCPEVDDAILNPRNTWAKKEEYD